MVEFKIKIDSVGKNRVDIFLEYFPNKKPRERSFAAEPVQKAFTRGPLSIGMTSFPKGPKLEKIEKKEKLKNRDLIENPFII